jgi:hypothetical protein
MIINEILLEEPQIGDPIDLEFGDTLIETVIEEVTDDGVLVKLDESAMKLIISAKKHLDENKLHGHEVAEAKYQGRKVQLGKPFLTPDGPKKRSVYVKNSKGNVVKVNFGQKGVKIKKNNPARRKSFRARHNCSTAKDRTTARYWSCRFW